MIHTPHIWMALSTIHVPARPNTPGRATIKHHLSPVSQPQPLLRQVLRAMKNARRTTILQRVRSSRGPEPLCHLPLCPWEYHFPQIYRQSLFRHVKQHGIMNNRVFPPAPPPPARFPHRRLAGRLRVRAPSITRSLSSMLRIMIIMIIMRITITVRIMTRTMIRIVIGTVMTMIREQQACAAADAHQTCRFKCQDV